ncbi:YggT family protein [Bordetella tumulicola]|uniref:YggT family protein n=1 Tax=Bordetella tumulicola TaxID=1649133 RepID=UPI0039EE3E9C
MLGDILRFLFEITFTLFGAALIARAWIHAVRLHPFNPLARGIYQFTNWLILPIRKLIPSGNAIDWPSLVGAWLTALLYLILMWLVSMGALIPAAMLPAALGTSLLMVVKWALNLIIWLTLLQAVLSWISPLSPLMPLLQTLTAPMLEPIRRILPRRSAIDFSPLVLLILAQIVLMMLSRLTFSLLGI